MGLGGRVFFGILVALVWGTCAWSIANVEVRNYLGSLLCIVFLFTLSCPLVDCILWKLRLDERGVTHTAYGWEITWPWGDFESGTIEMVGDRSFVRTDWPWWRIGRKLHLAIDPEDRLEVLGVISRHCYQSKLLATIDQSLRAQWTPLPTGRFAVTVLKLAISVSLAMGTQFAIVATVICAWIILEMMMDFEFVRLLDEQDTRLFVASVWLLVGYLSTNSICALFARIGLHREQK